MRTLLVVLAVSGVGCGGGVDPRFAGVWTGTLVVTLSTSGGPVVGSNNNSTVEIVSAQGELDWVTCADKSGRLRLDGVGPHATWSGVQSCPAPSASCSTATAIFRNATADLVDGRIKAIATGTAASCGNTYPLTYEFNGTK